MSASPARPATTAPSTPAPAPAPAPGLPGSLAVLVGRKAEHLFGLPNLVSMMARQAATADDAAEPLPEAVWLRTWRLAAELGHEWARWTVPSAELGRAEPGAVPLELATAKPAVWRAAVQRLVNAACADFRATRAPEPLPIPSGPLVYVTRSGRHVCAVTPDARLLVLSTRPVNHHGAELAAVVAACCVDRELVVLASLDFTADPSLPATRDPLLPPVACALVRYRAGEPGPSVTSAWLDPKMQASARHLWAGWGHAEVAQAVDDERRVRKAVNAARRRQAEAAAAEQVLEGVLGRPMPRHRPGRR